jgi:hypothetical protein
MESIGGGSLSMVVILMDDEGRGGRLGEWMMCSQRKDEMKRNPVPRSRWTRETFGNDNDSGAPPVSQDYVMGLLVY